MNDEAVEKAMNFEKAMNLVVAAIVADGNWDGYTEDEHRRCARIHAQLLNLGDDHLTLMSAHGISALAYRAVRATAPAPTNTNGKLQ